MNDSQSLGSPVRYASESALRGDDLLDTVLEDIRAVCKKRGVAIIVVGNGAAGCAAEIVIAEEPKIKLGELLYVWDARIGYTRTAYRRTTPPNPQTASIQPQKEEKVGS